MAWLGLAWLGWACPLTWLGLAWLVWLGLALVGLARLGLAWLGWAWLGSACPLAWLGSALVGLAPWLGLARVGLARLGVAWLGLAWLGCPLRFDFPVLPSRKDSFYRDVAVAGRNTWSVYM